MHVITKITEIFYVFFTTGGVNLFRSLGGRGSGLRNFQFLQNKCPIVPKIPIFQKISRQKFPTPFFLVVNTHPRPPPYDPLRSPNATGIDAPAYM